MSLPCTKLEVSQTFSAILAISLLLSLLILVSKCFSAMFEITIFKEGKKLIIFSIQPSAFFPESTTKSPRTTPIGAVDNNNFANFDAFSSTAALKTSSTTTKTFNNNNNNNNNDGFFDAFNDNFNANQKSSVTGQSKLDPFGDFSSITTKSSGYKVFDENENGFEDDFFKLKLNDNSVNSKKSSSLTKKSSQIVGSEKIADRFLEDYSKTDTFDSDLAEALKRSMAEK